MSLLLTTPTVEILKNLATINQTLLFPKGNVLSTRSVKKHTYADVQVEEKFPKRFTIYDLEQFLQVVTQFEKPALDFDEADEYVKISDESGGLAVKYHYGDETLAFVPDAKKKIALPSVDVAFKLTEANFRAITNMARTLGTPELGLKSDGTTLNLVTMDTKNSSTNTTSLSIGDAPNKTKFTFVWKIEYLKLIAGTYEVEVCKEGLSKLKNSEKKLVYHVLLDANSTKYGE